MCKHGYMNPGHCPYCAALLRAEREARRLKGEADRLKSALALVATAAGVAEARRLAREALEAA
jgi:hypothetical protein